MKKLLFLFALTLFFISCEKHQDFLIPNSEVPVWLKAKIAHDEKVIESTPQSGLEISAWIRYKWEGKYFFEYRNGFSSLGPEKFNFDGEKIMLNQEPYLNFEAEKCCKEIVWKTSAYIDY
jgi:hypothetical protein